MSWVTIIWAMFSSAYLTLALVHVLVWRGRREVPGQSALYPVGGGDSGFRGI